MAHMAIMKAPYVATVATGSGYLEPTATIMQMIVKM